MIKLHNTTKIKNKKLHNKSIIRLEKLREIEKNNGTQDLQFEAQDIETKQYFWRAIDELKAFIDNIS